MPIYEDRNLPDSGTIGYSQFDDPSPSFMDTLSASFRSENIIGSYLTQDSINANFGDVYRPDPNYNVYEDEDFKELVRQNPDDFVDAHNKNAAGAIAKRIDVESADRRTREASGWTGFLTDAVASVLDPTILIPGGSTVRAGKIGYSLAKSGASVGIAAGVGTAVQEVGLQSTQITRTAEESLSNIGGSVILGGLMGMGAAKFFSNAEWRSAGDKLAADLVQDATNPVEVSSEIVRRMQSVGAASVEDLTIDDLGIGGPRAAQVVANATAAVRLSPGTQLMLSPSAKVREITGRLVDQPIYTTMNMEGRTLGAGAENYVKLYTRGNLSAFLSDLAGSWKEARKNGFNGTRAEFYDRVSYAARRGDVDENQYVMKAAQSARSKIFDPLAQDAIGVKILPDDIKTTTATSYVSRLWNRAKLVGEEPRFAEIAKSWLRREVEKAKFRFDEAQLGNRIVEANELDEKFNSAFQRLSSIEERLTKRGEVRQGKVKRIENERNRRFDFLRGQAPREVIQALRSGRENDSLASLVREARDANNIRLAKTPVLNILKRRGGVRVGSPLAQELKAIGVTPKRVPGLFKKDSGRGAADNIVASDFDIFDDVAKDSNGYVEQQAILDAIEAELRGNPLRSSEQQGDIDIAEALNENLAEWLERVGLEENSSIGQIRQRMREVLGNDQRLAETDTRIANLERELQEFDDITESIGNERIISESESKNIADELQKLEDVINESRDLARSSKTVKIMVDYADARKDFAKARYDQTRLTKRGDALRRLDSEGRLTPDLARELDKIEADLPDIERRIAKATEKSDKLRPMLPKQKQDLSWMDDNILREDYLEDYINDTYQSIFNNLTGKGTGEIPEWIVPVTQGVLKERTFNIPDELIEDFLTNDIELIARRYVRQMGSEIELTRAFGRADMQDQIKEIREEYAELRNAAQTADERLKLDAREKRDITQLQAMRDQVRGTYRAAEEGSTWTRITRAALTWNYIRLLGGQLLSSLTDAVRVPAVHGVSEAMNSGMAVLKKNTQAIKISISDSSSLGTIGDRVLQSKIAEMAELNDPYAYGSRYERFLSNASNIFSKATGIAWWNDTMRTIASVSTQNRLLKNIIESGADYSKLDKYERAYMGYLGIDQSSAWRILDQYNRFGVQEEGIYAANVSSWDSDALRRIWGGALNKDVDRTIIIPGAGDIPLWAKTNTGRLVTQFKSFGLASNQRVLIAGLQERPQRLAGMMVFGTALGMMVSYLKLIERGDTEGANNLLENPGKWIADGLDRTGILSLPFEASNTAEKLGLPDISSGISRLVGDKDSSGSVTRYASRGPLGAVLGPTAGAFEDFVQIANQLSSGDLKKSGVNAAFRQVPGATLPGVRSAIHVGIKPAITDSIE